MVAAISLALAVAAGLGAPATAGADGPICTIQRTVDAALNAASDPQGFVDCLPLRPGH